MKPVHESKAGSWWT